MRKRWKTLILTLFVMSCFTVTVNAAQKISINDLINNTTAYDMQTVTVEGEAIGEALERGDHAWVNINDGSNAIGIWMTAAETVKPAAVARAVTVIKLSEQLAVSNPAQGSLRGK